MNNIWRIVVATKSLWPYYLVIGVLTIVVAALNLLMPFLSGLAIDEIVKGQAASVEVLIWIAVAIFIVDLAYNLFSNISGYFGDRMAANVQRILAVNYYQHILGLTQDYFDRELTGKIINRLTRSIGQIASFMQVLSNNFLQFIFSSILALIVVAIYSWPVALMLLALYPVFAILTVKSSPKWRRWQHQKNDALDISSGRFAEAVGDIRVVKSFNQQKRELKFFSGYQSTFVNLTNPQSRYWHSWDVWRRLAMNIIFLGIYLFIFLQAASGQLSAGDAVALILYAMQIRMPLFTISFLVDATQRAVTDSHEYFKAMEERPSFADEPGAKELKVSSGRVEFNNVKFAYEKDNMVLNNLNFYLPKDSKTALVGESGEGKTTITNLLLRLYQVNGGQITIDGADINEVSLKSLRFNIGVVFQEPALFSGTIKENIAYANPSASQKQIESAARAANAHDFIVKFKEGYNSQIGERGLKLSGGQKQRIAIARALLKDAPILILDEATSSLDSRSERQVQQALEHLMKNRTTLIVAHRLSTISTVDQIITLQNGTVDEIGTPAKLAKSGGIYNQLLDMQHQAKPTTKEELKHYGITS